MLIGPAFAGPFGGDGFQLYVLAHLGHDFLGGPLVFQVGVQVEAVDDLEQLGGARDPLIEGLQPLFGVAGHRGRHELGGNSWASIWMVVVER